MSSYLEISSIHCFKYLNKRRGSRIERFEMFVDHDDRAEVESFCRIFWVLSMLIAFVMFCFLIVETTNKFTADKIVLDISRKEVPIADIPFPAITVCTQSFRDHNLPTFNWTSYNPPNDE